MPVQVASFLIPKNGAQWYLIEDRFVKGGFRTVATPQEREDITPENRKAGMLVWVQSESSLWQLNPDLTSWINLQLGGIEGPVGPTGPRGYQGKSTYDLWQEAGNVGTLENYLAAQKGEKGDTGATGATGEQGIVGKSTYDLWLEDGNVGTAKDYLNSLKGQSAYQEWLELGFEGTPEDFLASQKGEKGDTGQSLRVMAAGTLAERDAYSAEEIGFTYLDEANGNLYILKSYVDPKWSAPIPMSIGIVGPQGEQGLEGLSAYDVWLSLGNVGTVEEYHLSNKGDKGDQGIQGEQGIQGPQGVQGEQGEIGLTGKSNYQVWLDAGNTGTEAEFFETVRGPQGIQGEQGEQGPQGSIGADGESNYDVWLSIGNTGTREDFILAQKGEKGDKGDQGLQGPQGEQGLKGDKGDQGVQGIKGDTGAQGTQGIKGDKGDKGDQGIQGPAGVVSNTVEGDFTVNGSLKYKNVFANLAAFPDAATYEGMFAIAEDTNKAFYSSDGTWNELAVQVERVIPYDLSFFIPGSMPTPAELVGAVLSTRTISVNAIGSTSLAKAKTAPSAECVYVVKVNGVNKGTVTFAAGSTNGVFALAQNLSIVAGDIVEIYTPTTIDSAIKDVMITIVGRAVAPQMSMSFA